MLAGGGDLVGHGFAALAVQRVDVEGIAELEILVDHGVAPVAAELLKAGGVGAAVHAAGQGAALEAVAAERRGIETCRGGAALDDTATVPGSMASTPTTGEGTGPGHLRRVGAPRCGGTRGRR